MVVWCGVGDSASTAPMFRFTTSAGRGRETLDAEATVRGSQARSGRAVVSGREAWSGRVKVRARVGGLSARNHRQHDRDWTGSID